MQLSLSSNPPARASDALALNGRSVPLILIRNLRARRYVLRLRPDGSARVTIPRGGSMLQARAFAERQTGWIEQQLDRMARNPVRSREWQLGMEILFRGESVRMEAVPEQTNAIQFGSELLFVENPAANLRPEIEKYFWKIAAKELPPKVLELAAQHGLNVRRVTVRNQRSRWGSCSRRGTISLNWRLIQAPAFVRDYIILHELMHLRQMNHSARFWDEVASVCPDYQIAKRWLKQNAALLR